MPDKDDKKLQSIKSAPKTNTPAPAKEKTEKDLLSEINSGISVLIKQQNAILEAIRASKDKDDGDTLEVCYPTGGGLKTLPTGSTMIDFVEGVVYLPGASADELEDNLKKRGGFIRSLTIEVQTLDMTISFDDRKATKLAAGRIVTFTNKKFRHMKIVTTGATGVIRFLASTNRNGALTETK